MIKAIIHLIRSLRCTGTGKRRSKEIIAIILKVVIRDRHGQLSGMFARLFHLRRRSQLSCTTGIATVLLEKGKRPSSAGRFFMFHRRWTTGRRGFGASSIRSTRRRTSTKQRFHFLFVFGLDKREFHQKSNSSLGSCNGEKMMVDQNTLQSCSVRQAFVLSRKINYSNSILHQISSCIR